MSRGAARRGEGRETEFRPSPDQLRLVPEVSGNAINGLGEPAPRRPTPIYWHDPARLPHGRLMLWFRERSNAPAIVERREAAIRASARVPPPVAERRVEAEPGEWAAAVKAEATSRGADAVGIARMRPEWVFEGYELDAPWVVVIAVEMDYGRLSEAPGVASAVEVLDKYVKGTEVAHAVAAWIRERGWNALPHGGPSAGPALMIPAAIAAGIGELGKHGSLISRRFGASFRLACVFTDMPLVPDSPDSFGADDFCANCRICERACPPAAILPEKQVVRGDLKWYVDFDRCVLYFNENNGCAICLAVCPWSRPGVAPRLAEKLTRRRERRRSGSGLTPAGGVGSVAR